MPRWSRFVALAAALLLGGARFAPAQSAPRAETVPDNVPTTPPPPPPGTVAAVDSARGQLGERLQITIYTYGPGNFVFERFGHVAISVADTVTGEDIAYNWGMFDFNQPRFLQRFLSGETRYWMAGYRTVDFNTAYRSENRTIRAQRLALSPMQRGAVADYVAWNAAEANRYYRYDYYGDNCSTRVRDVLDWATGGQLQPLWSVPGDGRTWRGETARITADDAASYAGIQIALGRGADRTLMPWEETFLPEYLAEHLATAEIVDSAGQRVQLVQRDTVIFTADRIPMPDGPPSRTAIAFGVGALLAVLVLGLGFTTAPAARYGTAALAGIWFGVGGVLGTALLLAGTVTKHAPYMGRNLSVLQLHPLLLLAALLVPLAFVRGVSSRAVRGVTALIAGCAVLGAAMLLLPGWQQHSSMVVAVTVPVHLAFAVAIWRLRAATA